MSGNNIVFLEFIATYLTNCLRCHSRMVLLSSNLLSIRPSHVVLHNGGVKRNRDYVRSIAEMCQLSVIQTEKYNHIRPFAFVPSGKKGDNQKEQNLK